jgi:hypothetical protein
MAVASDLHGHFMAVASHLHYQGSVGGVMEVGDRRRIKRMRHSLKHEIEHLWGEERFNSLIW